METETRRRGRPPLIPGMPKGHPARRLPIYGSDEDMALLAALAEKWECSRSAALRRLLRQAAKREKVTA